MRRRARPTQEDVVNAYVCAICVLGSTILAYITSLGWCLIIGVHLLVNAVWKHWRMA